MSRLGHQLVQQADLISDALAKEYQTSNTELKQLLQFSHLLSRQFQIFSSELGEVAEEYFREIGKNQKSDWNGELEGLRKGVGDVMGMLNRVSKDIEDTVKVPIELFIPTFLDIYDGLKVKASNLKEDIANIVESPCEKQDRSSGYLGYNGVIMSKKRSFKIDISDHQSQYSELIKELNHLHSSKHRTLKSAYRHLTAALNEIPAERAFEVEGKKLEMEDGKRERSKSLSQGIIQGIKGQYQSSKLLKLIPQDPELEHLSIPQLAQSRIQKEVHNLLKSNDCLDPQMKPLILEDIGNIGYFLDCLNCEVESEIVLSPAKYYELAQMMRHILKLVVQEENSEDLVHTVLLVTQRVHCQGRVLIKELAKDEGYWLKLETWLKLLDYLSQEIEKQKQRRQVSPSLSKSSDSPLRSNNLLRRSFQRLWLNSPSLTPKQDQNPLPLQILKQINTFLIKLQLPNQFSIKVILSLCQKQKISKTQFQKLIKEQKVMKRQSLERKHTSSTNTKLRKEKKMMEPGFNRLGCMFKLTLPFLGIGDYLNLMVVDKASYQVLTQKVYKQLLQGESPSVIGRYRNMLYKLILKAKKYSKEEYEKLVAEIPSDLKSAGVINQDAKRCLRWAPQHQPLLVQILSCYSFHHPETKYLQGMHCLCQHLLHLQSTHPQQIYSMFQTLIDTFFKDILKCNFQKLRMRMYQYSRVLQIHYPRLAEHFLQEKLEAEHYIIQWVLTLWGDKQGEIIDVLWDGFIVSGWRWWIKVCVWLLGVFEKELLLLNFDSILKHINGEIEITTLGYKVQELRQLIHDPDRVREEINKVKISDSFQKDLELQFDYSDYKLTPFLNTPMSG